MRDFRVLRCCAPIVIALPVVTACVTDGSLPAGTPLTGELSAARLPQPVVGDRIFFSNGRSEQVTGVAGERITWRRSSSTWYTAQRDFTQPEIHKQTSAREVRNKSEQTGGGIWPLELGRRVQFRSKQTSYRRDQGKQSSSASDWVCQVDQAEHLTLAAGSFDTYRIACSRSDLNGRLKQQRYWYYAPRLGQPVLRIDRYPGRSARRIEMIAFDPALSGVRESSRSAYQVHFQRTMEMTPSGEAARWKDPSGAIAVNVRPLRTIRLKNGSYCRNYETTLFGSGRNRIGAGLVCRNPEGLWSIPDQVVGS